MSKTRRSKVRASRDEQLTRMTSVARSVDEWCARKGADPRESDRRVWMRWAADVLAERGLLPEPIPTLTLGDLIKGPETLTAWSLYLKRLAECIERAAPGSAEWFAGRILRAGML